MVITLPHICVKVQRGKFLTVSYLTFILNLTALQCVSVGSNYYFYHYLRGYDFYEVCFYVCQRSSQTEKGLGTAMNRVTNNVIWRAWEQQSVASLPAEILVTNM